jgi:iron complex transport system permease protein
MTTIAVQPMLGAQALRRAKSRYRFYIVLLAGIFVLLLLEMAIGTVHIPLAAIARFLAAGNTGEESWNRILLMARLPRLLNAMASGAALGVCGILLQTLFRNSLADPYVLGTVHGARLGVAAMLSFTGATGVFYSTHEGIWRLLGVAIAAALGSGAVTLILVLAARHLPRATLLILGLMLGFISIGLIDTALHFADESQAAVFKFWDHGSFGGATWPQLAVILPVVALGCLLAASQVKSLNVLVLGESYAASMGIPVVRVRMVEFAAAAILAGVVTAFSGPVAFVGLVVAQLSRTLLKTSDHRELLPAALLLGATLGLGADLIVHLPWKGEPPHVDSTFALIGGPVVVWRLLRARNKHALDL